MKAIIFNSGMGNRMEELTKNNPKCMVELYNGETILERQIRLLSKNGIKDFIITVGPYKEQIINITEKYNKLNFTFVENMNYKNTNYIVSMNNAYKYLDDDILVLHGDLVFNNELIKKVINNKNKSICLFNEEKKLPQKDFKGRFFKNKLKEVSISIFDEDCYAFQPLYKLSKEHIKIWKDKVKEFVEKGDVLVYAENALNEVLDKICIYGISYKDDYIEEIDNKEDYTRVSNEIKFFDYKEQKIEVSKSFIESIKKQIKLTDKIFIVCGKRLQKYILNELKEYNITIFNEYSSNPKYYEIKNGINLFKSQNFNLIISIGGGSTIDVAKCIKLFSSLKNEYDFLEKKYCYSRIKHIAIPTTAGTGSESTQFAVMYYKGEKLSIDNGCILPESVILDSSLLNTLSDYQKKSTLLDSLCQAIESYWAKGANNESREYAKKCINLILDSYKKYLSNDVSSYKDILIASNFSGKAINISRTTSAHSMSYKLTSLYGISHGHSVSLCLIPIWELLNEKSKNNKELKDVLMEIAKIFKVCNIEDSISEFKKIFQKLELTNIKIRQADIDVLVNSVNLERIKNNPVEFNKIEIRNLYKKI